MGDIRIGKDGKPVQTAPLDKSAAAAQAERLKKEQAAELRANLHTLATGPSDAAIDMPARDAVLAGEGAIAQGVQLFEALKSSYMKVRPQADAKLAERFEWPALTGTNTTLADARQVHDKLGRAASRVVDDLVEASLAQQTRGQLSEQASKFLGTVQGQSLVRQAAPFVLRAYEKAKVAKADAAVSKTPAVLELDGEMQSKIAALTASVAQALKHPALEGDIDSLLQLVFVEIAKDAESDLRAQVESMKEIIAQKKALRARIAFAREDQLRLGSLVSREYDELVRQKIIDPVEVTRDAYKAWRMVTPGDAENNKPGQLADPTPPDSAIPPEWRWHGIPTDDTPDAPDTPVKPGGGLLRVGIEIAPGVKDLLGSIFDTIGAPSGAAEKSYGLPADVMDLLHKQWKAQGGSKTFDQFAWDLGLRPGTSAKATIDNLQRLRQVEAKPMSPGDTLPWPPENQAVFEAATAASVKPVSDEVLAKQLGLPVEALPLLRQVFAECRKGQKCETADFYEWLTSSSTKGDIVDWVGPDLRCCNDDPVGQYDNAQRLKALFVELEKRGNTIPADAKAKLGAMIDGVEAPAKVFAKKYGVPEALVSAALTIFRTYGKGDFGAFLLDCGLKEGEAVRTNVAALLSGAKAWAKDKGGTCAMQVNDLEALADKLGVHGSGKPPSPKKDEPVPKTETQKAAWANGKCESLDEYGAEVESLKGELENLGDMSAMEQLKLQMLNDRRQKAFEMLSNLMKSVSNTQKGIIDNLK